jgi:hypothetical protein
MTYQDGPDRDPEGEQLLVRHLTGDRLTVKPPSLAEEEITGIDDLLDFTQRLRVGLAQLTGDQAGQGFLVGLDDPADRRDRPAPDGSGDVGPQRLCLLRRRAGGSEGSGVGEGHLGNHVREPGRVG